MNTVKRLWWKVTRASRGVLLDLFGEDSSTADSQTGSVDLNLDVMQTHLDELSSSLAALVNRQKQLAGEISRVEQDNDDLDRQIDQAVSAGNDGLARDLLVKQRSLTRRLTALNELRSAQQVLIGETRANLTRFQERLLDARRQAEDLQEKERNAAVMENLAELRRNLGRDLDHLTEDIQRRRQTTDRLEDRLAVRKDIERTGKF